MEYEWDEAKRRANLLKHGIDFAQVGGFDWISAIIEEDRRKDYGERRLQALGFIADHLHRLVFTERRGRTRVISLRRANNKEKVAYATSH